MDENEVTEETPGNAGEEAEAATAEGQEPTSEEQAQEPEEETKKPPKGVQKRLNELTRLRYEAEERERKAQKELDELKRQQSQPAQQGEPKESEYEDYEDYLKALGRWEARQEFQRLRDEERQTAEQKTRQEREQEFIRRSSEARIKYNDFDEASRNAILSDPMTDVLINSDKGPDMLYYLGTHADESYRISQLNPLDAARELGKLEAQLQVSARQSKAPPPPAKIGAKENPLEGLSDDLPIDEWIARRRKQRQNQ